MNNNENPLGKEKIYKLLIKFSVPAIIGMMVNAVYNIVDRIYIGNSPDLGANGLAGITIGFPIMMIQVAIGVLFGTGGATLFSLKQGEGKIDEAENTLGNTFTLLLISGAIILIFGQIFLEPLLKIFGASELVLPYSVEYMRVIFFGSIFQIVSMGFNNFIRADGSPKIAMYSMFLGAGVNIVLDPLFIFVFKMGMAGAGLATIIAQGTSFVWVLSYFLGKRSRRKLRTKYLKLKLGLIRRITSLGLPGFFLQLANSLLTTILNKGLLTYGGDIAISGMGVVNSFQTILIMPIVGLNQGVQPIISFNYGAKKYDRVKSATRQAIAFATAIAIFGFIITQLFPAQLTRLFNNDPELIKFGEKALVTWFLALPIIGFQIIAANFFQAIGRYKSAMFLTLTRRIIFLIPAIIIFPKFWGLTGILYAAPFADVLSAMLTGVWYYFGIKDLTYSGV